MRANIDQHGVGVIRIITLFPTPGFEPFQALFDPKNSYHRVQSSVKQISLY